ncbi:MAG: S4 domain-containing protein [Thermotogota bacterium]
MRLDKFLKKNRIIKRRVVAHDLCVNGKVLKDNRELKPGYDIKDGDRILIDFGKKLLEIEALENDDFKIVKEEFKEGE